MSTPMRLSRLILLLLAGNQGWYAAQIAAPSAAPPANEPLTISTGPYLQSPETTSMTIMWLTNRDATGWVEYSAAGGQKQTAVGMHYGLIDANERIHQVTISGLKPGTRYQYRVWSQDIRGWKGYELELGDRVSSMQAEFRTNSLDASQVSFLVFNDIHDNRTTIPDLLKVNGNRPYELLFFNGDIVTYIDRQDPIVAFLDDATKYFATQTPFVWVRGNHETYGARARTLPQYVGMPQGRFYYSFDYGPVHFTVLDTGDSKGGGAVSANYQDFDAYRREEAQWFASEIRTPAFRAASFRVVLAHMPFPLVTKPDGSDHPVVASDGTLITWYSSALDCHAMDDANQLFGPLMKEGKVDLLIAAHVHNGAILKPDIAGNHDYPVITGGGREKSERTVVRVEADREKLRATLLCSLAGYNERSIEIRSQKQKPPTVTDHGRVPGPPR
jgi:UDP-2,3-diacylglucosamine pyrophosphatase LpxH